MPEVLAGSQPGLDFDNLHLLLCDDLGYKPENNRFRNKCLRWANSTIRKIQLDDPQNRRTVVHDAEFTLAAGTSVYDMRASVENGGFGFSNIYEVLAIRLPSLSDYPLELISLDDWHNRGVDFIATSGPTVSIVLIDKFRIRVDPVPDQAYEGKMDFYQLIPQLVAGTGRVEWPETWDEVLLEGTKAEAYKVHHKEFPAVWKMQWDLYQDVLADLKEGERITHDRPKRAISTRNHRRRRYRPRDNSTDHRHY